LAQKKLASSGISKDIANAIRCLQVADEFMDDGDIAAARRKLLEARDYTHDAKQQLRGR